MVFNLVHLIDQHIRLVIFDIDQTLMDTQERNDQAFVKFMERFDLSHRPELREYILSNSSVRVAELFSDQLRKPVTPEEINDAYIASYLASTAIPIEVFPDAIPVIDYFKMRSITTTAVTSANEIILDTNMATLTVASRSFYRGVDRALFEAIVYGENGKPHKPEYAAYTLLEERLGRRFQPTQVLVIGDSRTDELFARNIGAWFRRIYSGYTLTALSKELGLS
ncbi:HAD family hydrolase [Candidatus Woesearchaeota archaeon]|nr:HAD family hydrolase [Candidatus Woesearchaeota archaeon]